ncbi:HD domain-containing phosphohydrolase [Cetobacterium sp.]|uniref:HD domain-containing phosphohydrolase n=1 Tax=Cetobacterium sp. TaxID=2071632 RepID=UPI003F2A46D1
MVLKILFFFCILFNYIFCVNLTLDEKEWISNQKENIFNIYIYNPNHIFFFRKKNDEIGGVYYDFFKKVSDETGLKFEFKSIDRNNILKLLKNGDGDIIFNPSKTTSREGKYFFLPTLMNYSVGVYTKKNKKIDITNLKKYKVAVANSTSTRSSLAEYYPHLNNFTQLSNEDNFGFEYLDNNRFDAVIGKSNSDVFKEYHFTPLKNIPIINLWLAINKSSPILYSIISKYKEDFKSGEIQKSLKKERPIFYETFLGDNPILANLKKKYSSITVLIPKDNVMLPLFYKSNGEYDGYITDRLDELSLLIGVPIKYTENPDDDYDIKAVHSNVFLNSKSNFYIPYYEIEMAIFSKISENFIGSYIDTANKNVGFISPEVLSKDLFKNSPKFESYKVYKTTDDGLNAILKNEINYLYGDFKITSMAISNRYLENNIKVSGFLNKKETIGFSIKNDPELYEIFEKFFPDSLSENNLLQKELQISKRLHLNYKYVSILFSFFLIIILILFYSLKSVTISSEKEKRIARALVHSFEAANELNDEDTGNHILRVNLYSKFIAEKLKCSSSFIKQIGEYASLHDVGKIAISDAILKKPGKLTPKEFEDMKKHVVLGKDLVVKMELGKIAENIALYHHEKWNGSGYYYGLQKTDIPLEARIVGLADVYDALRQKRIYKDGFSHEKAVQIISEENGKHFDPDLVNIFLRFNEEFDKIFIEN